MSRSNSKSSIQVKVKFHILHHRSRSNSTYFTLGQGQAPYITTQVKVKLQILYPGQGQTPHLISRSRSNTTSYITGQGQTTHLTSKVNVKVHILYSKSRSNSTSFTLGQGQTPHLTEPLLLRVNRFQHVKKLNTAIEWS